MSLVAVGYSQLATDGHVGRAPFCVLMRAVAGHDRSTGDLDLRGADHQAG